MAPLIKFTATHYRKDGVSHEDFIKWFTEQHLPAALPLMKKYGIKKYNLVRISQLTLPTAFCDFPADGSGAVRHAARLCHRIQKCVGEHPTGLESEPS